MALHLPSPEPRHIASTDLPRPRYAAIRGALFVHHVAPCGTFGLFLDFGRLGWLLPGYGYLPIAQGPVCAADRLIVTVIGGPAGAATYRLIADGEGDQGVFWQHLPTVDGHPSLSSDGTRLLTDTYPDRYNEQRLLVVEKSGAIRELGRFRPAFDAHGARRCDLHPRWDAHERMIIFDSTHDRGRALYLLHDHPGGGEDAA